MTTAVLRNASAVRAERIPAWLAWIPIMGVALLVRIPLLTGGLLDYDEGVYWQSLRAIHAGHPLFFQTFSSQPPAFLTLVGAGYNVLGQSLTAARLMVLILSALGYVALLWFLRKHVGVVAALVAGVLIAIDPITVRESVTLQADSPATWLGVLGLVLVWASVRNGSRWAHGGRVLGGVALGVAVLVKLFAATLALPVLVLLVYHAVAATGTGPRIRRFFAGGAEVLLGVVVAAAAFLLPYLPVAGVMWREVVGLHATGGAVNASVFPDRALPTFLRVEAVPVALGILGALLILRRRRWTGAVLLAWLAGAVGFLAVYRLLYYHHLVLAAAAGIAGTSVLLPEINSMLRPRWRSYVHAAAVAAAVVAALVAARVSFAVARSESDFVPTQLQRLVPQGTTLVTDDPYDAARAGISTPPELVDSSYVAIAGESFTASDVEGVIIRDDVRAVYMASGRLSRINGLQQWVATTFPQHHSLGSGVLYTR